MKLSKKTRIIFSVAVALVMLMTIAAILSMNRLKPKNHLKISREQVDLEIQGFVFTEVGKNNSKWEVKADSATFQKKQNLAVFEHVRVTLNAADGKVYVMTADKGEMLTDKKDFKVNGNVVITSNEGDKFTTDYLNYSDKQKKFYTDAPVTMENNRIKIKGTGLELFTNTGRLNLSSMVKAKIKQTEQEK
ncbi:MAG TPA: LPS export ABC transporter periplasmic protein LptC [Smithellaceae bacterium]|jgi:LPS export ABC transporter protein LptC|nr:LPS export ABC transporter periplasmic protein LptC [Syntrophaceae bacterium]MDX9815349.1 LPS export ABC transporter periplasmic protein LptC [Smithellaceae bacterium]OPZ54521.1 MAG: LPS-assembly protein LptD [Deltaproteobacteria bacterium ADurb.BinA014]MBP8608902.1 LPS export ABC transporter periplasmic protein LptC [Syntrophaceae bacterium]HNQ18002.1 LPS export ABC transporter periplasmic protein LptC [Smithellaceae bacterium]